MEEREHLINTLCEQAVDRLAADLPGREVACLVVSDDVLRHVAHRGALRFIFELPRDLGGIVWRTAETGDVQIVPDVTVDPDYVASDGSVTSEICAPVRAGDRVVAVIDVESTRPFSERDAEAIVRTAERLTEELTRHYSYE